MDQKDLIVLLKILKKNGVTSYKDEKVELKLELDKNDRQMVGAPTSANNEPVIMASTPKATGIDEMEMPSDESFLYWSSGHEPDDHKTQPLGNEK